MKKCVFACLISSVFGAILAIGLTDQSIRSGLTAQETQFKASTGASACGVDR